MQAFWIPLCSIPAVPAGQQAIRDKLKWVDWGWRAAKVALSGPRPCANTLALLASIIAHMDELCGSLLHLEEDSAGCTQIMWHVLELTTHTGMAQPAVLHSLAATTRPQLGPCVRS